VLVNLHFDSLMLAITSLTLAAPAAAAPKVKLMAFEEAL